MHAPRCVGTEKPYKLIYTPAQGWYYVISRDADSAGPDREYNEVTGTNAYKGPFSLDLLRNKYASVGTRV